jgi:lysophospholipase
VLGGPAPRFETIEAADGTALRTAVWQPTTAEPRGTVVLLQGRIEFIEKYCETAGDILDRGFAVFSLDWRGQGESARALPDRHKDYVGDYAEFLRDFDLFLETVVLPEAPKPIFVMAHSMGGHITLRHLGEKAARGEPYFAERVVLCAPMVDIAVSPLMRFVATVLTAGASLLNLEDRYAPGGGGYVEMPYDDNPLTRDRARFDRTEAIVRENPALALGWPTYGWVAASRRSIATLRGPGYPEAIRTPVLLLSAGADTVVSNKAQAKLAARMPNCQFESIPDARHELLMETDAVRQQFFGHVDAFVGLSRGDTA